MARWLRHTPAPVSRLLSSGVCPRLSIVVCLLTLAIQLAVPVAQIWHIATDHTSAVALLDHHPTGQSAALRLQVEPHRNHEFDNLIDCPVCHAFVYMQHVIDIRMQVVLDVERSVCPLPLTGLFVYKIFLYTSAPRASPILS